MFVSKQNYKTLALKLFFSIALLIVAGVLVYKNFVKNKRVLYVPPSGFDTQYLYSKFDLDVLDNEVFKELREVEQIKQSAIKNIGRENPFLEF